MPEPPKVVVLGEGIVGLTCAIVLKIAGFRVSLAGREGLLQEDALDRALIASALPAASVLVHSLGGVHVSREEAAHCEAIFRHFSHLAGFEVARFQRHYEVFDSEPQSDSAMSLAADVVRVEELPKEERSFLAGTFDIAPDRLSGWRSRILFIEYPGYVRILADTARRLGIGSVRCEIDSAFLRREKADLFVNCLGPEAGDLLMDDELTNVLLGGLLVHDRGNRVDGCRGRLSPFSYNAKLATGPYAHRNPDGSATDLYCYPRKDCVVLGGTRQVVAKDGQKDFIEAISQGASEPAAERFESKYEETFLGKHRDVLERAYGMRLSPSLRRVIGFRPVRMCANKVEGPRLELTSFDGVPLVHCYGFGGAGLTLSWWAAAQVRDLVATGVGSPRQSPVPASTLAAIASEIQGL